MCDISAQLGTQGAAVAHTHPHNEGQGIQGRNLWKGVQFLSFLFKDP